METSFIFDRIAIETFILTIILSILLIQLSSELVTNQKMAQSLYQKNIVKYSVLWKRLFTATITDTTSVRGPSGYLNRPDGGHKNYRNLALYGGIPFILISMASCAISKGKNEKKEKPSAKVQYEYLNRRTKRFPWGDGEKSFFQQ